MMLGLPASTEVNRKIPKQTLYDKLTVSPKLHRAFVEQVQGIWWRNKIDSNTANIADDGSVPEIEVFEIKLSQPEFDIKILQQIDKAVPYYIVFLVEHEHTHQAWIAYKEPASNSKAQLKVRGYYHTDWYDLEEIPLKLDGLTVQQVYENFVRQIAGDELPRSGTLSESVERGGRIKKLEKEIKTLQGKRNHEVQFNKQILINTQIKQLRKELAELEAKDKQY